MATIAIIDYGMGNLRSVAKALEHVSPKSRIQITQSAHAIEQADRVVFPGQGAIRDCMHELATHGLIDAVKQAAAEKPFLGLCLGPQALLDFSEENKGVQALGVLAEGVDARGVAEDVFERGAHGREHARVQGRRRVVIEVVAPHGNSLQPLSIPCVFRLPRAYSRCSLTSV